MSVSACLHPVGPDHRESVTRKKDLGPERNHLAERRGPLPGEALHLLRIAGVGRGPDEEVAAAERLCSSTQVQVWSSVSPFAWWRANDDSANLQVEPVRVSAVRVPVVDGPLQAGHLELAPVDHCVVAGRPMYRSKRGGKCLVRDHDRGLPPSLCRLVLEHWDSEDVVDVAVRVDRCVEAGVAPLSDLFVDRLRDERRAGVDEVRARQWSRTPTRSRNEGMKATPGRTSASAPWKPTGCSEVTDSSPRQSLSATSRTSSLIRGHSFGSLIRVTYGDHTHHGIVPDPRVPRRRISCARKGRSRYCTRPTRLPCGRRPRGLYEIRPQGTGSGILCQAMREAGSGTAGVAVGLCRVLATSVLAALGSSLGQTLFELSVGRT